MRALQSNNSVAAPPTPMARYRESVARSGWTSVDSPAAADIVVLKTCNVNAYADRPGHAHAIRKLRARTFSPPHRHRLLQPSASPKN